ncbi:unnamed protein product, partial [Vitis vinifera]
MLGRGWFSFPQSLSALFFIFNPWLSSSSSSPLCNCACSDRPAMDLDFEKPGKRARYEMGGGEGPRTSFMERLPRDIILDILSRLPVTSLVQFRFVCRGWRLMAQDSLLASKHLCRTAQYNPCLILHCDYPIRNQISFVDISAESRDKDMVRKLTIPFWASMPEFEVGLQTAPQIPAVSGSRGEVQQDVNRPHRIWRNAPKGRGVRLLCLLKNGEILLEYKGRVLVSYNPERGKFKDLTLKGLPNWFQTFVHVGSLSWIDSNTERVSCTQYEQPNHLFAATGL